MLRRIHQAEQASERMAHQNKRPAHLGCFKQALQFHHHAIRKPGVVGRAAPGEPAPVIGDHPGMAGKARHHGGPGDATCADSRFQKDSGGRPGAVLLLNRDGRPGFDIVEPLPVYVHPAAGRGKSAAIHPLAGGLIEKARYKERDQERKRNENRPENPAHRFYLR